MSQRSSRFSTTVSRIEPTIETSSITRQPGAPPSGRTSYCPSRPNRMALVYPPPAAGDAEAAAQHDGEDRHAGLGEGDHPLPALADRAGHLVLDADGEAGAVDQVEHREVEQVAQVEVADQLVAARRGHGAAVDVAAV